MSRTITDEEIGELRRSGFSADGSARGRILSVLGILLRFTDEEEGVSASEIARVVGACSGRPTSENAVLKDLHQIQRSRPVGIEIRVPKRGENVGFRAVGKPLSSEEAILVSDVIRACRLLSPGQREDLCGKILRFASEPKVEESVETVFVDDGVGRGPESIFPTLRTASKAIADNERVAFRKEAHLMNGSYRTSELIEEDPVAIVFSYGRYYLETCRTDEEGHACPGFHRLDDVVGMFATGKPIENRAGVDGLRMRVAADVRQRVDMYGNGQTRTLFLRVAGSHAKYVYDRFGHDVEFRHVVEEGEDGVVGYACVRVQPSPTFFRWLFGMQGAVEIARPKGRRWVGSFPGLSGDELPALRSDFRFALAAYADMLSAAVAAIDPLDLRGEI